MQLEEAELKRHLYSGYSGTLANDGLLTGEQLKQSLVPMFPRDYMESYPALYEGTTPVEPKKTPEEGYNLFEDMTDKACAWVSQQKALAPDKPFFVYFAPGAIHAPHHVPKEWADNYKGKFDSGCD